MMRAAPAMLLGFVLILLAGCISGLSGGSVPIGIIDGTVYTPTRALQTLPRAAVVLRNADGQVLQTTISDAKGRFAFNNVPYGDVEVASSQGTLHGCIGFTLQEGVHVRVALTVAAVNANVVKLNVHGSKPEEPDGSVDLDEDEEDSFTVEGEDSNGQKIVNLPVSWAVIGDIGAISPEGLFSATRPGNGELIVQHDEVNLHILVRVRALGTSDGRR